MERISPSEGARRKSAIVRRYVTISGRNSSVCLESAFWGALKEIAANRNVRVSDLVATINKERQHANLSSAIRLFVLDHYRGLADRREDWLNANSLRSAKGRPRYH
jgi:predicted DNA-binding ribbon-helix-helix protein